MYHVLYKFNRFKAVLTNRIRNRFPAFPLIVAALALAVGASSCYTLLKHPYVPPSEYGGEDPEDVGCLSCHPGHYILPPDPRPPGPPPWWLDHPWGNELETVPIHRRDDIRPTPGKKYEDDPPVKIPGEPPGVKIQPGGTVKQKENSESKDNEDETKDRTIRPKEKKKTKDKEDG